MGTRCAPCEWPDDASAKARFVVPSSPGTETEDDTEASYCRITFQKPSGVIRVVLSDPGDDGWTEIIDEFDPADVIGAELEIKFIGSDLSDVLAKRFDEHGEGRGSGAQDNEDEQCMERFQDTDDCAGILPPRPTEEELTGVSRSLNDQATAFLNVYCYPRKRKSDGFLSWCNPFTSPSSGTAKGNALDSPDPLQEVDPNELGHRFAHHRRYEVAPCFDFSDARAIVRAIRQAAKLGQFVDAYGEAHPADPEALSRPRRYLVIGNPHSGKKQARRIYDSTVNPMLDQAGVEHDLVLTEYAGHARDLVSKTSEDKTGEVEGQLRTALERQATDEVTNYDGIVVIGGDGTLFEILQGIRERPDSAEVLGRVKFGVIGSGTSNGLAKSVLHQCVEKYSVLESTFLICKGQSSPMDLSRYEVQDKVYTGFLTFSWAIIADVDLDSECVRFLGSTRTDLWAVYRILAKRSYRARFSYLPGSKVGDKTKSIRMPALNDPVPEEWETTEGDFILFWASQVSHAAYNTFQSPLSQLQDGLFHVMIVRKPITRAEMIQMFLNIETGGHIEHEKCEQIDCVAFRLCPHEDGSHNDLDGEKIESGPIQAQVLPASMLLFSGAVS